MVKKDVCELLRVNPYPGRGIIVGCSEDGGRSVMLYFIMGRSENSRNRVFAKTDDGIRTAPFDPAKITDPSLVIYHPVRVTGGQTIVTNGKQTDTIRDYLSSGRDFRSALLRWEFEPDAPNYTPRISGLVERDGSYSLSILKTSYGSPDCCLRSFFEYSAAIPGLGHFISTYKTDGEPLPAFEGEPIPINIASAKGLEYFANTVWNSLNDDNKVSLYARETVIVSGESLEVVINKNQ